MSTVLEAKWSARADEQAHATGRALLFLIAQSTYAVSVDFVERVIELPPIVNIPRSAQWLQGLAVYESMPLPLIDLRYFLQADLKTSSPAQKLPDEITKQQRAIVIRSTYGKVLLGVDQLITIAELSERAAAVIERAEFAADIIEFTCNCDGSIVGVISIPRLLQTAGNGSQQSRAL